MDYRIAIGPSSFAEIDNAALHLLEEAGCEVVPNPRTRRLTEGEITAHLKDVDGLIAGLEPLNRSVLESATPRLKAIARVGTAMDNVDLDAAKELDIAVSNTPDGPVEAVAEMTVAALLALGRNILPLNAAMHKGKWNKQIGFGLNGTKVLLIGYGRIGQRVGQLLHSFGAHVIAYDAHLDHHTKPEEAELVDTLIHGLHTADVVSLHASGTHCILDAHAIGEMKHGSVLLNSARGELVDEDALIAALDEGRIAAAWIDVFSEEPYSGPLTKYDQVLLTPHTSTYTRQCRHDMETAAVRNLLHDLGAES